jgi:hypothetical protein
VPVNGQEKLIALRDIWISIPHMIRSGLVLAGVLSLVSVSSASVATNSAAPLSTRVVDYGIDAHIDTAKKTVDATETLTYKNLTGQPLTTFPFHLYLNAFQPDSSFTTETHFGGGIRDDEADSDYPAKKMGSITITQLTIEGMAGDFAGALRFVAPDDGNAHDHTVAELKVPQALAPGESIRFHIKFHDQFPESIARNGYKRDFLIGGQWYPKLGVFWHGAWNCHQYHSTTEFFSDFATFAVRLTLPRNYTVGASGVPTGDQTNEDGTRTLSFYGEDIHDFAWAASPHFTVTDGTFLSSMGPVRVHVLALAAHPGAGQRYLDVAMGSLKQFDQRFGPYPYKILTAIDPEPDSQMEGMEYPTLITAGTAFFDPTRTTEITTEHEFGHQYWYGMVATNEFEDAWLDEGINSYTEVNVTAALYGRMTNVISLPWINLSDEALHYFDYMVSTNYDPVTRHAWQFRDTSSYNGVTYGKSATLLKMLEGIVGRDTMDEAMRTYFMRYRFTHPTTDDFLRTIQEVAIARHRATGVMAGAQPLQVCPDGAGLTTPCPMIHTAPVFINSSLEPFLDQAVYGTAVLDFAIDDISSGPMEWWKPEVKDAPQRSTVTVHRVGDFLWPVAVRVVFSDGSSVKEFWNPRDRGADSNDRWKTFTYVRRARVVSAEVDPDHTMTLDVDEFNNSRTEKTDPVPGRKLAGLWMSAMQFVSQMAGWLV